MNLHEVLNCLGKPVNDLETARILNSIGVENLESIQVQDGKYSEYFISKPEGFSLIFTDEAMFLGKAKQIIGVSPLYFAVIFLYAGGKDGYSSFPGELPAGIRFDLTREDLINLLGEPSWQRQNSTGGAGVDRWDEKSRYRIHITYSPEARPAVISLHMPNA